MKNWKENRPLAALILAAAVLLGTFGVGGAKLSGQVSGLDERYQTEIGQDLSLRVAAAENLVTAAGAALGADAATVQSAQAALAEMAAADGPKAQAAANAKLTAAVGLLYEDARAVLGDEKGSVLQTQWSEFLSRGDIINRAASGYNAQAQLVQQAASGFPGGLIGAVIGAEAEPFLS